MKKGIVFIVLWIFFIFISKYIFDQFSPFNLSALQEIIISKGIKPNDWASLNVEIVDLVRRGLIMDYLSSNVYLLLFSLSATVFCFFVAIHLVIDKVFF